MTQNCPTCGSPLDPTHAPIARVRGARVVAFCSEACASGTPAAQPAAPEAKPAAAKPQPKAKPKAQPKAKAQQKAQAKAKPPQPQPQAQLQAKAKAKAKAEAKAPPNPIAKPEPVSARQLIDEEPDPLLSLKAETRVTGGRRRTLVAFGLLVLTAGVAVVAFDLMRTRSANGRAEMVATPERTVPSKPPLANADPEPTEVAQPAEVIEREVLFRAAQESLAELFESPSPRVRRLAAQALSRIGDERALKELRELLDKESSQLGQLQIAYALARAGDTSARKVLVDSLGAQRRDVRLDAARALVRLGDKAGLKTLESMLSLSSHRLGVAEYLVKMGNDKARQLLVDAQKNKSDGTEAVIRAKVALGRTGDASVRQDMLDVLGDRRYRVGAAQALAAMNDPAAVEPLNEQLALSAVRVPAALALRRMGQGGDLSLLAKALQSRDEVQRVSAAEAVLILTGPEAVAERD